VVAGRSAVESVEMSWMTTGFRPYAPLPAAGPEPTGAVSVATSAWGSRHETSATELVLTAACREPFRTISGAAAAHRSLRHGAMHDRVDRCVRTDHSGGHDDGSHLHRCAGREQTLHSGDQRAEAEAGLRLAGATLRRAGSSSAVASVRRARKMSISTAPCDRSSCEAISRYERPCHSRSRIARR